MVCDFDENIISEKEIANAVKKAGFKAYPEKSADSSQGADRNAGANPIAETDGFTPMKTRLIVSLIFLVLLMYVSIGHMIGLPVPAFMHGVHNGVAFALVQFLLVLPILYVNRKFYVNGFKALWHRVPNMDSLVAVGSSAAVIWSFRYFHDILRHRQRKFAACRKILVGTVFRVGRHDTHAGDGRKIVGGAL
ncbi:MAG: hypothetical protein ACLTSK_02585 [Christensenellales bacterium]